MPGRPHTYSFASTADTNESAANTETVIATLTGVQGEFPGQTVALSGWAAITPGTTATAMTLRIRQDSLTGTVVGEGVPAAGDVVASKLTPFKIDVSDVRGGEFSGSYVLTMQGTGEGTAAVANTVSLRAIVA